MANFNSHDMYISITKNIYDMIHDFFNHDFGEWILFSYTPLILKWNIF